MAELSMSDLPMGDLPMSGLPMSEMGKPGCWSASNRQSGS